jgi:transposase
MFTFMSMPRKADAVRHLRRLAVQRVRDGYTQVDVAKFLGVSDRSVRRWSQAFESEGVQGLTAGTSPGPPLKLKAAQVTEVLSWLSCSPRDFGFATERWTAPRLAEVIRRRLGIVFNHRYLNRWLAGHGITPQIPATVAREQDPAWVQWWVTVQWPRIKKKRKRPEQPSFLPTKAGF